MLTDLAQSLGIAGAVTTAGLGVLSAIRKGGPKEAQRIGASLGLGAGGWGGALAGAALAAPLDPFTFGLASVAGGLLGAFGGGALGKDVGGALGRLFHQATSGSAAGALGPATLRSLAVQSMTVAHMTVETTGQAHPGHHLAAKHRHPRAPHPGGGSLPTWTYEAPYVPTGTLGAWVQGVARRSGVPASLIDAVMAQESGGNPYARSSAGALGLMQLMPGTASWLGVNPLNPQANLAGGAAYLARLYSQFGNVKETLAAYNAGPGTVAKEIAAHGARWEYYMPQQTQTYVADISSALGPEVMREIGKALAQELRAGVLKVHVVSTAPSPTRGLR